MKLLSLLSTFVLATSCSLVGIQNEEGPKYKVIKNEGNFEIREYSSYIVAKTTIKGDYKNSSGKAFRILAGYIFGKNKTKQKIAMTSPVEVQESSTKIAMTSPVLMDEKSGTFTMSFSMPSKYKLEDLPKPLDGSISFETVPKKIVAASRFSWFSGEEKRNKKVKELKAWIAKYPNYKPQETYTYAGYNPPWTIPFFRRNEVMVEVRE
jgi:hypothetical protein